MTPASLCVGCSELVVGTTYFLRTGTAGVLLDAAGNELPALDTRDYWAFEVDYVTNDTQTPEVVFVGGVVVQSFTVEGYIYFSEYVTVVTAPFSLRACSGLPVS
ncbi:unnamed protein product [Prorocentrum cordatum]|uniref:Uncharacterized protein n=1 Tax=Prorocentrum cordatum TaxID=2364126 RepID=A0ABN9ULB3_9DINO|nr:unnamed protein product [Polarella glacialis]